MRMSFILSMNTWWPYQCSTPSVGIDHDGFFLSLPHISQILPSLVHVGHLKSNYDRFDSNWSSEQSPLVRTTLCTAPFDFFMISVWKSCADWHAWSMLDPFFKFWSVHSIICLYCGKHSFISLVFVGPGQLIVDILLALLVGHHEV